MEFYFLSYGNVFGEIFIAGQDIFISDSQPREAYVGRLNSNNRQIAIDGCQSCYAAEIECTVRRTVWGIPIELCIRKAILFGVIGETVLVWVETGKSVISSYPDTSIDIFFQTSYIVVD